MSQQNSTEESWPRQLNQALEHMEQAHSILTDLHLHVDSAHDDYNPVGIEDAETNLEILRTTADDLENLRDQTEVAEIKSKLQMEEEELKENLEWVQQGRHNDGRPKPVVKLDEEASMAAILHRGTSALEAAGRENELPKLTAELEISRYGEERMRVARRWFHVLVDQPQAA